MALTCAQWTTPVVRGFIMARIGRGLADALIDVIRDQGYEQPHAWCQRAAEGQLPCDHITVLQRLFAADLDLRHDSLRALATVACSMASF
jgi:hypothetical protein